MAASTTTWPCNTSAIVGAAASITESPTASTGRVSTAGGGGATVTVVEVGMVVVVVVVVGSRANVVAVVGEWATVASRSGVVDTDAAVRPTASAAASTTTALVPASAMRRRTP